MKTVLCLLSLAFATPINNFVADQYIVVFNDNILPSAITEHWKWLENLVNPLIPASSLFTVQEDPRNQNYFSTSGYWDAFGILHKYSLPNFKGYAVRLPAFVVKLVERHTDIAFVEKDQIMSINGVQANAAPWGLPRISVREHPSAANKTYTYPDSAGSK